MTFRRIAKFSCSQMLGATSRWLREGWNKVKESSLTTPVEGSYADDLIAHKDDKEEGFLQYKPPLALSHRCQEEEKMSARSTPSVSTHLPTAWHRISMILLPDTSRVPLTLRPNRKSTNLLPSGLIWAPWWASGSWTGILHFFLHVSVQFCITALHPKAYLTSVLSYHHKWSCISSLHLRSGPSCCAISLLLLPHWSRRSKQKGQDSLL